MEKALYEQHASSVPRELRAAIDANAALKEILQRTGLPRRFQAMVLGLAAFRQLDPKRSRR